MAREILPAEQKYRSQGEIVDDFYGQLIIYIEDTDGGHSLCEGGIVVATADSSADDMEMYNIAKNIYKGKTHAYLVPFS